MHHVNGESCPACEQKLESAHPFMNEWALRKRSQHPQMHVSWTFRGEEDQEKAFDEGKSNAHFGESKHNTMKDGKPCAEAVDIFELNEHGQAVFDPMFCAKINMENEIEGLPIRWGGTFKKLKDNDHFEMIEEA